MSRRKNVEKKDPAESFNPDITIGDSAEGATAEESQPESADIVAPAPRRMTALTPDSDRFNRAQGRKMTKQNKGEHVTYSDEDAIGLFTTIQNQYPAAMIGIRVSRIADGGSVSAVQARPMRMSEFRDSRDFYDRIMKEYHRDMPAARYKVIFEEGAKRVGDAFMDFPNTLNDHMKDAAMSGQPPFPPPMPFAPYPFGPQNPYAGQPQPQQPYPYGPPPQGYGAPPSYANPGYPPPPAPPPPAPPPAPVAAAPAPPPAPAPTPVELRFVQPEPQYPPYHMQQPPPQPAPAPIDHAAYAAIAGQFQELKEMQNIIRQNQIQMAQSLGAQEEMRRWMAMQMQQMQQPQMQPQMQMPQMPQQPPASAAQAASQPAPTPPAAPSQGMPGMSPYGMQGYMPGMPGFAPGMGMPGMPGYPSGMPQGYPPQGIPGYPPQGMSGYPQQGLGYPGFTQQGMPQGYPYPSPMNGYGMPQHVGMGAPPLAPPPAPAPTPQQAFQQNPLAALEQSASMITGVARTVQNIRKAFAAPLVSGDEEEEATIDDDPMLGIPQPNPVKPPPYTMMPISGGPDPVMLAMDEDGKINAGVSIVSNLGNISKFIKGIGETYAQMASQQQGGQAVEMPQPVQYQQAPPQALPMQQTPMPFVQPPQAPMRPFIPNANAMRQAR